MHVRAAVTVKYAPPDKFHESLREIFEALYPPPEKAGYWFLDRGRFRTNIVVNWEPAHDDRCDHAEEIERAAELFHLEFAGAPETAGVVTAAINGNVPAILHLNQMLDDLFPAGCGMGPFIVFGTTDYAPMSFGAKTQVLQLLVAR